MKIRRNEIHANGSVLLVTLLTALIIGIALASYLALVSDQNRSSMRALAWNACIPVLEAGIEEALSQIHYNGIARPGANAWQARPDGRYYKTRPVGNDGSYYEVSIEPVDPPVIVSVGYVPVPLRSSSTLGMIFGQIVGGSSPQSSPKYVSRRVRVNTIGRPMFSHAMLAKENIYFSGSARTDSFDSTDPGLSTNGKYDPAKARDKGDVASNGTVAKTFMGSMIVKIKGHLSTGPGGTGKRS